MPRKPKGKTIKTLIAVKNVPIPVTLSPPKPPRMSWYAFWPGLKTSRSTGQAEPDKAIEAVVGMLNNNGKLGCADDLVVSDEEFAEIQRRHFAKKKDPAAAQRAKKSLKSCLEAIAAFRDIAGVQSVATATAADCERFQTRIPTLPKDWLRRHDAKSRAPPYSPTAAIKWWRELQAAFERANRQAGKKCVRGVVDESRLLTENPWLQFTWIEGVHRPIRQFDDEELLSLLDYLETHWSGVPVSAALARVLLWSWGRKQEILGLKWDSLRNCGDEIDFETVGKRGVEKWFHIPAGLYEELLGFKTASPFVFADHNRQLRAHHRARSRPTDAELVSRKFNPDNVGKWFERRLSEWSKTLTRGRATIHVFRKTALQYADGGRTSTSR